MLDKVGDMMSKLKEAKRIATEIKEKLENTFTEADAAGGDIKIEINGNRKVRNIIISPALQHGDKQELEEQLIVAVNRAIEKADKINEEEMKKVAGGIIPGLF